MTGSVLTFGGNVVVFGAYVLTTGAAPAAVIVPPVVTPPPHDGGDGFGPQDLAALKRHLKQAKESQRKSAEKKRRAEKLLDDAIEAARIKLFGEEPKAPVLPRLKAAVEVAEPVIADNTANELASLQRAIADALTLIATIEAQERARLEQEEEDDTEMILLAA